MGLRKNIWIGCVLLAFSLAALGQLAFRASAAGVVVGPAADRNFSIIVTRCGNGVTEPGEECDPGKHCANTVDCTADPLVCIPGGVPIGDGTCNVVNYNTCSSLCRVIATGGATPQPTLVTLTEITARPEQRYSGNGNNFDTELYLTLLNSDNANHQSPIYQHSTLLQSNASGVAYPYLTFPNGVIAGTYDALIKPKAHLAKLQDNVYLIAGDNILNFTSPNNSVTIGSSTLTAGDIDGNGNSLNSFGDNVINSVDLSALLAQIGSNDSSGNLFRANLNQDSIVDQADLTILLGNLDKEGDK